MELGGVVTSFLSLKGKFKNLRKIVYSETENGPLNLSILHFVVDQLEYQQQNNRIEFRKKHSEAGRKSQRANTMKDDFYPSE